MTFAAWGYDFVKYDWCSYGRIAEGRDAAVTNVPTFGKGEYEGEIVKIYVENGQPVQYGERLFAVRAT